MGKVENTNFISIFNHLKKNNFDKKRGENIDAKS